MESATLIQMNKLLKTDKIHSPTEQVKGEGQSEKATTHVFASYCSGTKVSSQLKDMI